jgi:hypothetical protein
LADSKQPNLKRLFISALVLLSGYGVPLCLYRTILASHPTWVIGDNINDLQLMQLADRAFAIDPKSPILRNEPFITQIESFEELLAMLPNHELMVQLSV